MKFLTHLFTGDSITLDEPDLGPLKSLVIRDEIVHWMGKATLFNQEVEIFITGNKKEADPEDKKQVLYLLHHQAEVEEQCNIALADLYANAGRGYTAWKRHFNCTAISIYDGEAQVTFEEAETMSDFNVHFIDAKLTGTSIDR